MVTPIRPLEFILGKTIPFFLVGLALVGLIATVGTLWFRIPFVGNPLVLLLGTSLYLLSVLGIGLLISTLCSTQQQAFATNFFVVNPMFTLSGFSFPIASMPDALQWLTYLDPVRYYLVIIRGNLPQGSRPGGVVAANVRAGRSRRRAADGEHLALPQVARLRGRRSTTEISVRRRLSSMVDLPSRGLARSTIARGRPRAPLAPAPAGGGLEPRRALAALARAGGDAAPFSRDYPAETRTPRAMRVTHIPQR